MSAAENQVRLFIEFSIIHRTLSVYPRLQSFRPPVPPIIAYLCLYSNRIQGAFFSVETPKRFIQDESKQHRVQSTSPRP